MSGTFFASDEETELVTRIYHRAGCSRPGFISGDALVEIFTTSVNLTPVVLSQIWNIADEDKTGNLSERGLAIAIRLIGWAQGGEDIEVGLLNMAGPLPRIEGINDTKVPTLPSSSESTPETLEWPLFTARSRGLFEKLFYENGPVNDLLDGDKVRDVFLRTKLSPQDLWQIWNLADTQKRGALDRNEFALAMYLVQSMVSGKLPSIPPSVPNHVTQRIFEDPSPKKVRLIKLPSPHSPRISSSPAQPPKIVIEPIVEPVILPSSISRKEQTPLSSAVEDHGWDVTSFEKNEADRDFDTLDSQRFGSVDGDVVGKFMLRFKLSPEDLAQIWDLADVNNDNRFTRDEFAVAIHLIRQKLAGVELPFALPSSLIPPAMRNKQRLEEPPPPIPDLPIPLKQESPTGTHRPPPLPPKPLSPLVGTLRRRSISANSLENAEPQKQIQRVRSEQRISPVPSVPLDRYQALEREKSSLAAKVNDLVLQLEAHGNLRAENAVLKQQNLALVGQMQDMEQTVSQLLQATERLPGVTKENALLRAQVSDLEQVRSQLAERERRLDASTQENRELSTRLYNAREAAETAATRSAEEIQQLTRKTEHLEEKNEALKARAQVMERSISQSQQPSGSATNIPEMQILLGDVTQENETLKRRLRNVAKSTAHLMLTSSTATSVNDDLKRDNQRLARQVQELEQLTNQLQSSSEDGILQRVLNDVTQENEALKARVREMRDGAQQLRASSTRTQDLERELTGCREEVRRLQLELQSATATASRNMEMEEDTSMPPPAYDDGTSNASF